MNHNIRKSLAVAFCALTATLAICLGIMAWSEPSATPPGDNVAAPINAGSTQQTKTGPLGIKINDLGYWISQIGQSLAFFNSDSGGNPKDAQMVIGQDGNVGIGTSTPGKKLVVGGQAQANQFCLNGKCCSTWEECANGDNPSLVDCDDLKQLPAGQKRIFMTDQYAGFTNVRDYICSFGLEPSISGCIITATSTVGHNPSYGNRPCGSIKSLVAADEFCQLSAKSAGLSGTFKMLIGNYCGWGRSPKNVLSNDYSYWSVRRVTIDRGETKCYKKLVANNRDDFFNDNGDGNYLQSPVWSDEYGSVYYDTQLVDRQINSISGVYTGFTATGGDDSIRIGVSSIGMPGISEGNALSSTATWASANSSYFKYYHFYCVEQ